MSTIAIASPLEQHQVADLGWPRPRDDADSLWRTYYCHIFNPARLKVKAMQTHMPKKYWKNLTEAGPIPDRIASAEART